MNSLYVYADSPREWNCSRWNCVIPSFSLNKLEGHNSETLYIQEFATNSEKAQEACAKADIIIVERNFFGDTLTLMQYWKVRNKTVLAIFDDAYDRMHPMNVSHGFWTNGEVKGKNEAGEPVIGYMQPPPIEQFKWAMRIAKAIQVPSVNLAKDWSKYGKTYHVHNFLDVPLYMNINPLIPKNKGEIVVGWCGSMSHFASFNDSGVLGALKKIGKKYPNVKVLIGGDKRVFDMVDVKNKIFQSYVPEEQWTALLKSIDIGLAPLAGEYDKRRSWIKALEYMALKIPWIATDYITYSELREFGLMTKNGVGNWTNAISEMVENYGQYETLAETVAYDFAMEQDSEKKVQTVTLPLYEKLLNEPYP